MICLEHINDHLDLDEPAREYCDKWLPAAHAFKRRHTLLQQGMTFPYLLFVESGLLRSFFTDSKGQEHVIQFAPAGSWLPDNFDATGAQASLVGIDTVLPSRVMLLPLADYERLIQRVPVLQSYFTRMMQRRIEAMSLRVINYLTHATADKFQMFRDIYPDVAELAPRHMIASYLGIQPETLSRKAGQHSPGRRTKRNH